MSSRRLWTVSETRALLSCYAARKNEFQHSRKKKYAYQNLVEDLTSMGVLKESISSVMVENKIKYLLKAYKQAVDNNNLTGNCPSVEPYSDLMEEIFGDGVLAGDNTHVVNVGSQQMPIDPLITSSDKENQGDDEVDQIYTEYEVLYEKPSTSLSRNSLLTNSDPSPNKRRPVHAETNDSRSPLKEIDAKTKRQKKKTVAEKVIGLKIEWEREKEAAKRKRHDEKMQKKTEAENKRNIRHKEKIEMQKQLLEEFKMYNSVNSN